MLVALILLTCVSVAGRASGIGPVNGDFELIEAGVAFAIFAFMPLCQITGGHAAVDVFTNKLSPKAERRLTCFIDLCFAFVMVLIAVQLYWGMISKRNSGQTTLLIEFPVWWGYAICMSGAVIAAVVAVYMAVVRIAEIVQNKNILPEGQGAEH